MSPLLIAGMLIIAVSAIFLIVLGYVFGRRKDHGTHGGGHPGVGFGASPDAASSSDASTYHGGGGSFGGGGASGSWSSDAGDGGSGGDGGGGGGGGGD